MRKNMEAWHPNRLRVGTALLFGAIISFLGLYSIIAEADLVAVGISAIGLGIFWDVAVIALLTTNKKKGV